jgi:hypothetical protein
MHPDIALALIRRLVETGALGAADIQAICRDLPHNYADAVKAAWLEGMTSEPDLHIIDGGKSD